MHGHCLVKDCCCRQIKQIVTQIEEANGQSTITLEDDAGKTKKIPRQLLLSELKAHVQNQAGLFDQAARKGLPIPCKDPYQVVIARRLLQSENDNKQ